MNPKEYFYHDHLASERLETRFLTMDDLEAWSEFFTYEEATELFPPHFMDPRAQLERQMQRYAEQKYGLQAIILKETNEFIGQCGILTQVVDGITELEVGYHFIKRFWGNGYAPEAAKLFIDYAFDHQITPSLISIIDTRNIKSQRVADKNGLIREKQTVWNGMNVFVYRIQ